MSAGEVVDIGFKVSRSTPFAGLLPPEEAGESQERTTWGNTQCQAADKIHDAVRVSFALPFVSRLITMS